MNIATIICGIALINSITIVGIASTSAINSCIAPSNKSGIFSINVSTIDIIILGISGIKATIIFGIASTSAINNCIAPFNNTLKLFNKFWTIALIILGISGIKATIIFGIASTSAINNCIPASKIEGIPFIKKFEIVSIISGIFSVIFWIILDIISATLLIKIGNVFIIPSTNAKITSIPTSAIVGNTCFNIVTPASMPFTTTSNICCIIFFHSICIKNFEIVSAIFPQGIWFKKARTLFSTPEIPELIAFAKLSQGILKKELSIIVAKFKPNSSHLKLKPKLFFSSVFYTFAR